METALSMLSGGLAGAVLVWLLRAWISQRLKESIKHEYSQKLEDHKAELNRRIQGIEHESRLYQLRTSLFFDHQRNAFAGILEKIAEINRRWAIEEGQEEEGIQGPVPQEALQELRGLYFQHQLFLDSVCVMAVDLIFELYQSSFPIDYGNGEPPVPQDCNAAYAGVEFIQPLLAQLFREKIGVSPIGNASRRIAQFGAIRLVNHYHFADVGLPPKGPLHIDRWDLPGSVIEAAERNSAELKEILENLETHLKSDNGFFIDAQSKVARYLEILRS